LIIQLGVKECILTVNDKKKDHDLAALYGVIDRCGIVISEKRAADFTTKDIEGDIKRLLGKDTEAPTLRIDLPFLHGFDRAQLNSICMSQWEPLLRLSNILAYSLSHLLLLISVNV
jgi:hypothetical protein